MLLNIWQRFLQQLAFPKVQSKRRRSGRTRRLALANRIEPVEMRIMLSSVGGLQVNVADLQVNGASVAYISGGTAATVGDGDKLQVTYTVENTGNFATVGNWSDTFYLSSKSTLDSSAVYLGSYAGWGSLDYSGTTFPLGASQSYTATTSFKVPNTSFSGTDNLLIVANGSQAIPESNYSNNLFTVPVTLQTPKVDLGVSQPVVSPSTLVVGDSSLASISWTVTNSGTDPATGNWQDSIYLSTSSTVDNTALLLGTYTSHPASLAAGGSYQASMDVVIPNTSFTGAANILIVTDDGDTQADANANNNTAVHPVTLTSPGNVDLQVPTASVSSLANPGVALTTANPGQTLDATWKVQNAGTSATGAAWQDAVYASPTQTYNPATAISVAAFGMFSPLQAGASYQVTRSITLPIAAAGDSYLVFVTNDDQAQNESVSTNDSYSLPLNISQSQVLLGVSSIAVSNTSGAVTSANAGDALNVSWTVSNNGTSAASSTWYDAVYLSPTQTFNASTAVKLATEPSKSTLGFGSSYNQTASVNIPFTTPANDYLIVRANVYQSQFESNGGNNASDFQSIPLQITLPNVDLTVTSSSPPSTVVLGGNTNLSWTVTNNGTVPTNATSWTDDVYLSPTPQFEPGTATLIGSESHSGTLNPGASYNVSTNISPSAFASGQQYLLIIADGSNAQPEPNDADKVFSVSVQVTGPDLVLSNATAPSSAIVGNAVTIPVSWTVTNSGTAAAAGNWNDAVYLSNSQQLDSSAQLIPFQSGFNSQQNDLAAGQSYTASTTLTIPNASPGPQYLLFVTNSGFESPYSYYRYSQPETSTTDNVFAVPITLTQPTVNLVLTNATAPTSAIIGDGQTIPVSWTVQNQGTGPANGVWQDTVYLSSNPYIDYSSVVLTQQSRGSAATLAAGGSYTVADNVSIPIFAAGPAYLIFVANQGQTQSETNTLDDTQVLPISLSSAQASLQLTTATAPGSVTVGTVVPISWTVTNTGSASASADWYDNVYLSTTPTSQNSLLVSINTGSLPNGTIGEGVTPLAGGSSYTVQRSVTIPTSTVPGQYYLVFTTNNGPEEYFNYSGLPQSEFNNTQHTYAVPITLNAPDLVVSNAVVPTSTQPGQSIPVTYTVTNQSSFVANGSWTDAIYLSSKQTLDSAATLLTTVSGSNLDSEASFTSTTNVTIPSTTSAGSKYILIVTNSQIYGYSGQSESDLNNNFSATPINIEQPSLTITSVLAPATLSVGVGFNATGTVKNSSTTTTISNSTTDYLYFSPTSTFNATASVELRATPGTAPLVPGASYTDTFSNIQLPSTIQAGQGYLFFIVTGGQYSGLANTIAVQSIPVTIAPLPDLVVTSATAPTSAVIGNGASIPVSWTVTNNGAGFTDIGWNDAVYASTKQTLDSTAIRLTSVSSTGINSTLAAQQSYTLTASLTLPANLPAGPQYILFVINDGKVLAESNTQNDVLAVPVTLSLPQVNLKITATSAPGTAVPGASIPVSWTVENTGTDTASGNWTDAVYVSTRQSLDSSAVLLSTFPVGTNSPLTAGASYTSSQNVALQNLYGQSFSPGQYYLLINVNDNNPTANYSFPRADPVNQQGESNTSNNLSVIPITLTTVGTNAPVVDLTVSQVTAPTSAVSVNVPFAVSWTVQNTGPAAATGTWTDQLYFSDRSYYAGTGDPQATLLGSYTEGPLSIGQSYSVTKNVVIPNLGSTQGYLLVVTQGPGSSAGSNVAAAAISISPITADLTATGVTGVSSLTAGASITATLSVKNQGTGTTTGSWNDAVYLSTTNVLDNSAIQLVTKSESSLGSLAAGASYNAQLSFTIPTNKAPGQYYLLFRTNDGNTMPETNYANDLIAVPFSIQAPDLVVTSITAPSSINEGGTMSISWKVTNQGTGTATGTWSDKIYLSSTPNVDLSGYDASNSLLLSTVQTPSSLPVASNGTYTASQSVTIPVGGINGTTGNLYLVVVTNSGKTLAESDSLNNQTAVSINVTAPDLQVTAASVTGPLIANGADTVLFTVTNVGNGTATTSVYDDDFVYLSSNPLIDSTAQFLTSNAAVTLPLAAGASYQQNLSVTYPAVSPGNYYLVFQTSQDTNASYAIPVTLAAPDLTISSPSAPTSAVVGQGNNINVSFTVQNNTTTPAANSWVDGIYLSNQPTFDPNTAMQLATKYAGPMAAGGSYVDTFSNVPVPNFATGSQYLLLVVDINQGQGVVSRSDTVVALPITLTAPAVSLAVSGVSASATGTPGGGIPIDFTVTNTGTVVASATWQDAVYLSALPTMNASAQLLTTLYSNSPLQPNAFYQQAASITIPEQTAAGTWYLLFAADSDQSQALSTSTGSLVAQAIQISNPDLVISNATAPAEGAYNGTVNVSWTVSNIGTGTANGPLYDEVILSTSPDGDNASYQSVLYASSAAKSTSPLASGASYTTSQTLTIPNLSQASGLYYLIFETNAPNYYGQQVQGESNTRNDFRVVPIELSTPNADLIVSTASAPATVGSGATVTVNWTDQNIGTLAANGPWADDIYLSSSNTFNSQAATLLSSVPFPAADLPLAANASQALQANVSLPSNLTGQYYLFVVVNGNQAQSENNLANDVSSAIPIQFLEPDLTVTNVTVPSSAVLGAPITVSWTVENSSTTSATGTWVDNVYVSSNSQFDDTATRIGSFDESSRSPLTANSTYSDSRSISLPTDLGTGSRYIYVVTNATGTQPVSTTSNDTSAAQPIQVSAPDLSVRNVTTVPTTGTTAGQNVSVSWTVTNQGTVAAPATWSDAVYLSATSTLTAGTHPLAIFNENAHQGLAAGVFYNEQQSIVVPAALTGHLYLIVVTDINFSQPDSNEQNNASAIPFEVSAADPTIPSGSVIAPASGVFGQPMTVQWTVKDIGTGPLLDASSDQVYFSIRSTLDNSATLLTTVSDASQIPLAAGASYQQSTLVTVPVTQTSANGNYYIFVVTDANDQALETNTNNDIGSTTIALTVPTLPKLTASGLNAPAAGFTGQKVNVSWTDTNSGTAAATGPWVDNLYLVTDTQGDNPVLAAQVTYPGSLGIGQQSTMLTQPITLPGTTGTYYLMVVPDADGGVNQGPNAVNNTTIDATPINVQQVPLPDLVVSSITPPTGVIAGTTVPITYTITNNGNAPTNSAQWLDGVFLSQSPSLTLTGNDFNDGYEIMTQPLGVPAFATNASYLEPGQSYSQTVNVPFPVSASGTWYVYVVTNRAFVHTPLDNFIDVGTVVERNPINDMSHSAAFMVTPAVSPDLAVSQPQTPLVNFSGQPMNISWTVTNQGAGIAIGQPLHQGFAPTAPYEPATPSQSTWTDEVFMSTTATLNINSISLGTFTHSGALTSGASYTTSESVKLPVAVSGNFYFIVQTDVDGEVFESVTSSHELNATPSAVTVDLTPPPDLKTSILSVPTVALASHALTFTYQVSNVGAGTTAKSNPNVDWIDSFYLSPTSTYNAATAISLGQQKYGSFLDAGISYQNTISETLPNGLSGTYYLIVNSDTNNSVFELDLTGKVGTSASTIVVSSKPSDLVVLASSGPNAGQAGGPVQLNWTITNQGAGDTAVTSWQDNVYADTGSTPGPNSVLVASYIHNGLLNAGSSYGESQVVTLPISLSGSYNLFVVSNEPLLVPGQPTPPLPVYESNYANDTSAALPITIVQNLANLNVTTVTAPSTVQTGGNITVNWTVQNTGTGKTNSNFWYDDVWVSTKSRLGTGGTDVYLGTAQYSNPLAAGASYTASLAVSVPSDLSAGTYYFVVSADRSILPPQKDPSTSDLVFQTNYVNSQKAAAATTVTLGPNLVVSNITAPTTIGAGQILNVGWTVTNNGAGGTGDLQIDDSVYLSYDKLLSNGSVYIGTLSSTGGLGAGASYTQNDQFDVPTGLLGTFYVFVVTDTNHSVTEQTPANATAFDATALQILSTPPADLVAGTVTIPANAIPGQDITISYNVKNNGANPANGAWTDSLYLSPTPTWSVSDPLLGRVAEDQDLAAGASYTGTLTAPLPGVAPGPYYVIVRTNILDTIPETTLANNLSASLGQASIAVPALTLGTPVSGTLGDQQSAFYEVTVNAGQTLQVIFASQAANSLNELYLSFGNMPSRGNADLSFDSFAPNQTLTVPTTQAGTYYILAYGSSVPTAPESYTLTASVLSFALTTANPGAAGNAGRTTLAISGAQFDRGTTFALVDPNGKTVPATSTVIQDAATAYVTFDLTGAVTGQYTIVATASTGSTARLNAALAVSVGTGGSLQTNLTGPSSALIGHLGAFNFNYGNSGDSDVGAPLIFMESPSTTPMGRTPAAVAYDNPVIFLANSSVGPAGVLSPGDKSSTQIYYQTPDIAGAPNSFQYVVVGTDDPAEFDLSQISHWIEPANLQPANWPAASALLQKWTGGTWGGFVTLLDKYAPLVVPSQSDPTWPADILNLAIEDAVAATSTSIRGKLNANDLSLPVAGQTIIAFNSTTAQYYSTTSRNDGSFAFGNLSSGSYTFQVQGQLVGTIAPVTLASSQMMAGLSVQVTKGYEMSGAVTVWGSQTAIAGASLMAIGSEGSIYNAHTDSQGNFAIKGLPADTYTLYISAPRQASDVVKGITVTTSDVAQSVALAPEGVVTGNLELPAGGLPTAGFIVSASANGNTDPNQIYQLTSPVAGTFDLGGLPTGTYKISVAANNYLTQTISNVVVVEGQPTNIGSISFTPAATISGSVTSDNPSCPAAYATIGAYQGGIQIALISADGSGNFEFTGLAAGTYTIEPSRPFGFSNAPVVTVAVGGSATGVVIAIHPGSTISGTVTDPITGKPLVVPVSLEEPDGTVLQTDSNSNGSYHFTGLALGNYAVSLEIPSTGAYQTVNVVSTDSVYSANLTSSFPESMSGFVQTSSGVPISGAVVVLYKQGQVIADAKAGSDGSYSILLVQPGTYDLQVLDHGMSFAGAIGVVVGSGTAVTQNLLAGDNTLSVNVTGSSNSNDVNSVDLQILQEGRWVDVATTSITGNAIATFVTLAPGQYQIIVAGQGSLGADLTTTITEGSPVTINAAMAMLGGIAGKVTDGLGNPLMNAAICLTEPNDPRFGALILSAADGTYAIPQLVTGIYDISVVLSGYQTAIQTAIQVTGTGTKTANFSLSVGTSVISGTVVDVSGNPIANADVQVNDSAGHLLGTASTAANGTFSISTVTGTNLTLTITQTAYAPLTVNGVNVLSGATINLGTLSPTAVADPLDGLAGFLVQITSPAAATFNGWYQYIKILVSSANTQIDKVKDWDNVYIAPPKCPECVPLLNNFYTQLGILDSDAEQLKIGTDALDQIDDVYGVDWVKEYTQIGLTIGSLGLAAGGIAIGGALTSQAALVGTYNSLTNIVNECVNIYNNMASPSNASTSESQNNSMVQAGQDLAKAVSNSQVGSVGTITAEGTTGLVKNIAKAAGSLDEFDKLIGGLEKFNFYLSAVNTLVNVLSGATFSASDSDAQALEQGQINVEVRMRQMAAQVEVVEKAYDAYINCNNTAECDPDQPFPPSTPQVIPRPSYQQPPQAPHDPNNIIGPAGFGNAQFVPTDEVLPYTINFENDPTAGLPAQQVTITQQLDPNLNWESFRLGSFSFGGTTYQVPANRAFYQTRIDLTQTDGYYVDATGSINVQTGVATWTFTTVDPATGQIPTNPSIGFLPPDNSHGIGEGSVSYTIVADSTDTTGTVINAQATVSFYTQPPINTPKIFNTIDNGGGLTATVATLPAVETSTSFNISWTGTSASNGSAIAGYNVYVSDNGGNYTPFLTDTTLTNALFQGLTGHRYNFYALAIDNAGNTQAPPVAAQATTTINAAAPPVVSGVSGPITYVELAVPITIAPNLTITDSVNINSATVSFTNWQAGDRVQFTNTYGLQHTFVEDDTANTATLTLAATATAAQYQTTLRSLQFLTVAGSPVTWLQRIATFTVTDINSNAGFAAQIIKVNPVANSSPPVITGVGGTVSDVAPATPIAVAPNLVITDSLNIYSATVSFTNWQTGDRLQFTNTAGLNHTFVEDDAANTAILTITGFATTAQYQTTLRSVQFLTVAGVPVTWLKRIATFAVSDIYANSGSGIQNIQFNSVSTVAPPALSGINGTVSDTAPATPISFAPNLVITDTLNLSSATVSFANWQAGDRLQFTNTAGLNHTFVEDDAANTATLTITGFATTAQYQTTLRSVQFSTVAGVPITWLQRVATFTVNDIYANSGSGTQNIQFNPVSTVAPPALSGINGTVSDTAPATPISFAPNLVITDTLNLSSATVSFANWQAGDRVQFANTYGLQHTFVENDPANTAILTITGFATAAQYQTTLRSVQFLTVAGVPVTWLQRVATFTVNDIYANSGSGTQNIQFNPVSTVAPPVLSGINLTVSDTAPATPISFAPNLVITDTLNLSSATVSFANWQAGDRVQFANTYGLQHTFVENDSANIAILTITGFATAAQYQTTLRSVQFLTVAGVPVTWLQRVATFTVNDIYANSGSGTQNIQFNPVSTVAPPVLSGINGTVSDTTPATPISFAPNLVITDTLNLSSATVSFMNWQAGDHVQFTNTFGLQHTFVENDTFNTATLTITGYATATQYQTTLRTLQFWTVAGVPVTWLQRIAMFTINDIYANSGSGTQNIQFNPVSTVAPPTLSGINGTVSDTAPATPISFAPNLVITSTVNMSSATVSFTNWQAGDRLQFTNASGLQHTFVENDTTNTAMLTLSGVATAAQYRATLQSLQFLTVAGIPVTWLQRVATFTVTDLYGNRGTGTQRIKFNSVSTVAPPAVSGVNGLATYVALATPVTIAPSLVVTDSLNISSVTVSFTNWQTGDRLQFTNTFALQHAFVENDTANTASLTITGLATAAQYQTTLQSLQFSTVAANPVTAVQRVATFTVYDIYGNSGSGTQNIAVSKSSSV